MKTFPDVTDVFFRPRAPWDDADPAETPRGDGMERSPAKRRGRRPAGPETPGDVAAPAWVYHHLTVSGPASAIADFSAAARGPGLIPWRLDLRLIEEDVFHLAAAGRGTGPGRLSLEGCRILARQFCERVAARQDRAAALAGHGRACPFDLHALLPVPDKILALGPTHPAALAWLLEHWGITDPPRQIVLSRPRTGTGRRLPSNHAAVGYGFFTAGAAPNAALARLGARWPDLSFDTRSLLTPAAD
jgi:hypothetical protein